MTFNVAAAKLETNFGAEYSHAKMLLLFQEISEDGWSEEQFRRTLSWFLRNKPFPAWTLADWFAYKIPIHGYQWACKRWAAHESVETWEITPGVFGYTESGASLPFTNVTAK